MMSGWQSSTIIINSSSNNNSNTTSSTITQHIFINRNISASLIIPHILNQITAHNATRCITHKITARLSIIKNNHEEQCSMMEETNL